MARNFEHMDELIARVVSGEATAAELADIDKWRAEDPAHEDWYAQSLSIFQHLARHHEQVKVDVDAAWNRLNERIGTPAGKVIPLNRGNRFIKAAAAILLLACFGFLLTWYLKPSGTETVLLSASAQPLSETLPDGSQVVIDRNSEIVYTVGKDRTRQVQLKGEAYFKVEHKDTEPFVVEAGGVMVRDIGTAFRVKALPGSDLVEVSVEQGEVQFYSASNSGVLLVAGEKATYHRRDDQFLKSGAAAGNTVAGLRTFRFEATRLDEVVERLNAAYVSNIVLADQKLASCRLSVQFNNESMETILDVIAETLDLEIIKEEERILIKGDGCD